MQNTLAKTVSLIFYPSVVLIAALVAVVYPNMNLMLLSLVFGLLIPIVLSGVYFYTIKMPDTWVIHREYRYFPLLFSILSNLVLFLFLQEKDMSARYFTALSISVTTFCLMVTFYWKISLHMAGMGAIAGYFLITHTPIEFQLLWLLISILTAWARIFLKSHDIWQILAGYSASFAMAWICQYYFSLSS